MYKKNHIIIAAWYFRWPLLIQAAKSMYLVWVFVRLGIGISSVVDSRYHFYLWWNVWKWALRNCTSCDVMPSFRRKDGDVYLRWLEEKNKIIILLILFFETTNLRKRTIFRVHCKFLVLYKVLKYFTEKKNTVIASRI